MRRDLLAPLRRPSAAATASVVCLLLTAAPALLVEQFEQLVYVDEAALLAGLATPDLRQSAAVPLSIRRDATGTSAGHAS